MAIAQATGRARDDIDTRTELFARLRKSVVQLYDLPIGFWDPILGPELHFHLGHFSASSGTSLVESMRAAVARLAVRARPSPRPSVLGAAGAGLPSSSLPYGTLRSAG